MRENLYCNRLFCIILLAFPLMFTHCIKEENNTFNHLPEARYTVNPARGDNDTQFFFDASDVSDAEDPASELQVCWDLDNDGVYDTDFTTEKTFTHQYGNTGIYFPLMLVCDTKGMKDSVRHMIVVVSDLSNLPPSMPTYITPPNWQSWMEPEVIFKWTCSDPENDSLTFDLWTGRSTEAMLPATTGITEFNMEDGQKVFQTTYAGFELKKTYYWQIFAKDVAGNYTAGPVWRFTTRPE
ncbi:hypothetical protein [Lentimicrobium sp.]|jgi:hypothetical protein|uniref:hypothetical protein n=1 Tax=Lentimicrobium sp. TaxID=2034841 RepID=UPI0025F3B20A|nr:hypothetical protein [Lentimicrobium sp.]MCO5255159.1 hypothetical protein [Lentimicrobium sp.]HPF64245.1 hypothetical protein [Lentimicrobium sp.]HPJ60960.1 hypothetical protein [Lentimicrobium sp.]HPR25073.1 hypothetical protein [Lentimicrobium sp.]HRW67931.1 hypothetical protein [Lentimicrobium sp.]